MPLKRQRNCQATEATDMSFRWKMTNTCSSDRPRPLTQLQWRPNRDPGWCHPYGGPYFTNFRISTNAPPNSSQVSKRFSEFFQIFSTSFSRRGRFRRGDLLFTYLFFFKFEMIYLVLITLNQLNVAARRENLI